MASSAPPPDATDSPVLSLFDKRLRTLSKKRYRILQMEKSIAQGKRINKQQDNLCRSKPSVLATIDELEKLRPQLSSTLQEEFSLTAQRLPSDNGGEANNNAAAKDGTAGDASSTHISAGVPETFTSSGPAKDAAANDGTAGGPSGAHTSTEAQGMAASSGHDYEVFLSFRGPDTRAGFTDFLYTSLTDAGIHTFRDDESLRVGEKFEPKLVEAINQSKISIPIFSKGYAQSVWCLKELAKMVECQKTGRQEIKPIFYDVDPSVVRYQTKGYAKAFLKHKKNGRYGEEIMHEWRAALKEVSYLNGWDLHIQKKNRREGEFCKRVTQEIFSELKKANLVLSDSFVNVDNHVNAIKEMIGIGTSETRIIGIHGMGGIGKTTIAKMVYNELSNNFVHCCFPSNIREMQERKGIEWLQHQLISKILKTKLGDIKNIGEGIKTIQDRLCTKKVLLLLDDVDHENHMEALAGGRNWFGIGSKLIITTRNKDVLKLSEVDGYYEVNGMNSIQSLRLFSKYAFRSNSPLADYKDQSKRAIAIAKGLPLALEVIGSLLWHIEKEMWDATLKMLESVPRDKVQSKLKISYDALDFRQKRIFLDIACLFIGYDKDILVHFWDESIFFPEEAIKVLQSMSLIKINENNEVRMHDQLRDLGREIVRERTDTKIEKQSRVWDPREGLNLLRRHKGKKEVEALRLQLDHQQRCCFTYEGFENLLDLRFLEVGDSNRWGSFHVEERLLWCELRSDVPSTNENSDLLPQLRWLSWRNIPPTFNLTNFSMEDVVFLDLSNSKITDDWNGWSHMKVMRNLKVLDLADCQRLRTLPDELGRDLASLERLSLQNCISLERLPASIGNLKWLIELDISGTSIKGLPDSIRNLKNLKVVKMLNCSISKIPDALWTLRKLEEILAFNIFSDEVFHVDVGKCIYGNKSLRILQLNNAEIYALPMLPESLIKLDLWELYMDKFPNLSNLTNLKKLNLVFGYQDSDEESDGPVEEHQIPQWIGNLTKLESLTLGSHFVTTSPTDLSLPSHLRSLGLSCSNLHRLPRLPSSLSSLRLSHCESLCSTEDLSNLKYLSSLEISSSAIAEIQGLGCLENLRDLRLERLEHMKTLPDLSNLSKLRSLQVSSCGSLVEIQGELPQFLDRFQIKSCCSLEKLPDLSSLMGKQEVEIGNCNKLNVEAILGYARKNPRDFQLEGFEQPLLPDLSNLRNSNEITSLRLQSCGNLIEIQGELPESLEKLDISLCKSLSKLPDLSSLMGLREVCISTCVSLVEIQGEQLPQSLEELDIYLCESLEMFPDLSRLMGLREVRIGECDNLVEIQGGLPRSLEKLKIEYCESLQNLPSLSSSMGLRDVVISQCGDLVEIQGELPLGKFKDIFL